MTEQSYYNENGKHQAEYDRLWKLVPDAGQADTVAGEIIRSAGKISYEHYNNGFCNNVSGALNFLQKYHAVSDETYAKVYPYSIMEVYYAGGKDLDDEVIVKLTDEAVEYILANPELETTANKLDMLEFGDDDAPCEEDDEDQGW